MIPRIWILHGIAVAMLFWGHPGHEFPPCGVPTVVQRDLPGKVIGQADGFRCRVVLDRRPWTPWTKVRVCTAIAHEWGHLETRGHSRDPRSIMYPRLHPWLPCSRP